jgi:hypothetical protein
MRLMHECCVWLSCSSIMQEYCAWVYNVMMYILCMSLIALQVTYICVHIQNGTYYNVTCTMQINSKTEIEKHLRKKPAIKVSVWMCLNMEINWQLCWLHNTCNSWNNKIFSTEKALFLQYSYPNIAKFRINHTKYFSLYKYRPEGQNIVQHLFAQ